MPMPVATGLAWTSSTSSSSSAAHVPTTSTMASSAADLVEVHLLGRAPVQAALGLGERAEGGERARSRTRSGRRASVDQAADVGRGAHDGGVLGVHVDLRARRCRRAARARPRASQPPTRQPLAQLADLVEVGAGVDQRAERHVAGDAGEAVEPGDGHVSTGVGHVVAASPAIERALARQQPGDGAGGAEAVVDADDGDAGGARGEHGQQRGDALERGAVADAGGHGHDRRAGEPADHAGQRALHAGDHHHGVGVGQLGRPRPSRRWRPATPTSVSRIGSKPWAARVAAHSSATGRSAVPAVTTSDPLGRAGGGPPARRWSPVASRPPGLAARAAAACSSSARVSSTGSTAPVGRAARRRWRRTGRASCRARRPPRPAPGAAPGGGRRGRSRGRRRAGGAARATASSACDGARRARRRATAAGRLRPRHYPDPS